MNKQQAQGSLKHFTGKMQEQLGILIGSRDQQIKGIQMQVTGMAEKRVGDVKGLIREATALAKGIASHRRA